MASSVPISLQLDPIMKPISTLYETLESRFISANPISQELFQKATSSLPGGNTRTVLFYHPFPLAIVSASSSTLTTADGQVLTDLLGEYTAGLYGHSNPLLLEAITSALRNGLNFGSHHANEGRLAELIKQRFPSLDLVRFTNSGTEANLMAVSAAKVFTGREKILVFNGGYHGGVMSFGGGGSSANVPHDWVVSQYNDVKGVTDAIDECGKTLAAVLVEPMLGSGGGIPGSPDFLKCLRRKTEEFGALLIFDEVMTSRLHRGGGLQEHLGIKPDLTTLGKYIGGGMSFGAFGGRQDIMQLFDPRTGHIAHAGTFNNNVLTMAAGSVGLERIFTREAARTLQTTGDNLITLLNNIGRGTLMKVTGCGSIIVFHFTRTPVMDISCPQDLQDNNSQLGDLMHLYLLSKGFYIARRGFLALSLDVTVEQIDSFCDVVREFVKEYHEVLTC